MVFVYLLLLAILIAAAFISERRAIRMIKALEVDNNELRKDVRRQKTMMKTAETSVIEITKEWSKCISTFRGYRDYHKGRSFDSCLEITQELKDAWLTGWLDARDDEKEEKGKANGPTGSSSGTRDDSRDSDLETDQTKNRFVQDPSGT